MIAELTFKVFPAPKADATFSIAVGSPEKARDTIASLGCGVFEIEALEFVPETDSLVGRNSGNAEALDRRLERIRETLQLPDQFKLSNESDAKNFWNSQINFEWIDPELPLAKFPITPGEICEPPPGSKIRYSLGGNVAWVNGQPASHSKLDFSSPGLVIQDPANSCDSIWTRQLPDSTRKINSALQKVFDPEGKFLPF